MKEKIGIKRRKTIGKQLSGFTVIELILSMGMLGLMSVILLSGRVAYFEKREKMRFYEEVNEIVREGFRTQEEERNEFKIFGDLEKYEERVRDKLGQITDKIRVEIEGEYKLIFIKELRRKEYHREIYFPYFE